VQEGWQTKSDGVDNSLPVALAGWLRTALSGYGVANLQDLPGYGL